MTDYGLTTTGFVAKPLEIIKEEIEATERAEISPTINTSSASIVGQVNGIVASKVREIWELANAIAAALDPSAATAQQLDALAAITGTTREPAKRSTVTMRVTLEDGTTLPLGSVASVLGTGARFATTAIVVNSSGAPTDFDVPAESEETGPIAAPSGTLTVIATPVSGWLAVTNPTPAILGAAVETDDELRARRPESCPRRAARHCRAPARISSSSRACGP
jgi:uncharacterized phage protein gp47/JayE